MKTNADDENKIALAWLDYRKSVCDNKDKSQDDFEKYINLMASGALGLTITFIDSITPIDKAICIWIIAFGWILLAFTLLFNLYSHYKSAKFAEETIKYIDDKNYDTIIEQTQHSNKIINRYNAISIWSLITGILFIIIFVTINIYNMSKKHDDKPIPKNQPKPRTEERGRTIPVPPREKPNTNSNNNNN